MRDAAGCGISTASPGAEILPPWLFVRAATPCPPGTWRRYSYSAFYSLVRFPASRRKPCFALEYNTFPRETQRSREGGGWAPKLWRCAARCSREGAARLSPGSSSRIPQRTWHPGSRRRHRSPPRNPRSSPRRRPRPSPPAPSPGARGWSPPCWAPW